MNNLSEENLFGPLPKSYCLYFYYLSILGFVLLTLSLISNIALGLNKNKGLEFYLSSFMISVSYLIFYFQNRLLYSMCVN